MVAYSTTRLSSKGQVVIPEEIRKRLGLKPGCEFFVVPEQGGVVFRIIHSVDRDRVLALMKEARRSARAAGLKKSDVTAAIRRVRSGNKVK